LASGEFVPPPPEPSSLSAQLSHYDRDSSLCEVVWLSGALIDAVAVEKIGGFDPHFWPLMFVDADVSIRLQRSGYRLASSAQAVIHHSRNAARYDGLPMLKKVAWVRGRQRIMEQHGPKLMVGHQHSQKQSTETTPVPYDILAAVAAGIAGYSSAYFQHLDEQFGVPLRRAQFLKNLRKKSLIQILRLGAQRLWG